MSVSRETWEEMLDIVKCKILSIVRSEHVDAYLLSESSLFVFKHKIVLKTCGTTTLLCGLPKLLEIAAVHGGFPTGKPGVATPYRVFYSRKSFMFPDKQLHPHKSWNDEVDYLDQHFLNGSAYMVGKMNGEHWYLYLTNPNTLLTPPLTPTLEAMEKSRTETKYINFPESPSEYINFPMGIRGPEGGRAGSGAHDETLEILMTDLDPVKAKQFYLEDASAVARAQYLQKLRQSAGDDEEDSSSDEGTLPEELSMEGHPLGTVVSDACGLSDVYSKEQHPNSRIDAYIFTPCGFSANGVIPAKDFDTTHYFTVHVTPEPHCSYASFETNVPTNQSGKETAEVVEHVVDIFQPGRFSVTLFETKPSGEEFDLAHYKKSIRLDRIKGYKRVDKIVHDLDGYDLVFRYYHKIGWEEKA